MSKTITIYCASSTKIDSHYIESAKEVGKLLAQKGWNCCNGGGGIGLMQYLSDAVMAHGGKAIGVIPEFMVERGWHHASLSELHIVSDMHSRKKMMADISDAVVALPGGIGTLEELLEILTWKQLGLYNNPIIILNTNGYFDMLLEQFSKAVNEKFLRAEHIGMYQVAKSPAEVIEAIEHPLPWDSHCSKFAAI